MSLRVFNLPSAKGNWGAYLIFALLAVTVTDLLRNQLNDGASTQHLTGSGDSVRQILNVGIFLIAFVRLGVGRDLRQMMLPASLGVLLMWCWASALWALDPSIALRRLALLTIILLTIRMCVQQAGFDRTTAALRYMLLGTIALCFISIAVLPSAIHRATDTIDTDLVGDWRGILYHKNFAGAVCGIAIVQLAFAGRAVGWKLRWSGLAAAAYFLYRTKSKTSMGILAVGLAAGALYYFCSNPSSQIADRRHGRAGAHRPHHRHHQHRSLQSRLLHRPGADLAGAAGILQGPSLAGRGLWLLLEYRRRRARLHLYPQLGRNRGGRP